MSGIRTLIVDDEPLARTRIRQVIESDDEIEIVGECGDGESAISFIQEKAPDLVMLDVQMPGIDGFAVLGKLGKKEIPAVVFVTAYDEYALKAFEVHAVDYVLKPVRRKRLEQAVLHAKQIIRSKSGSGQILEMLRRLETRPAYLQRIAVKLDQSTLLIPVEEVDWIQAEDNYIEIHQAKKTHLIREKIGVMENRLDPNDFMRIHRSYLVNLKRIREVQSWFHRSHHVVLHDGTKLPVGRQYKQHLFALLHING